MQPTTVRFALLLSWTLLAVCLPGLGSGARILAFFPLSATSHHILFEPWIRALCKRGHQVTYLSPTQFKGDVPNLEKITFEDFWLPNMDKWYAWPLKPTSAASAAASLSETMFQLGNASLRTQEVKDVLQSNRQYDAVISESWFCHEFASVLPHRFNALHIVIQTFGGSAWANEMSGLPDNPSWMYDTLRYFKAEHPSNFLERLYNFYITTSVLTVSYWFTQTKHQSLVDELVRYPGWENRPRLTMLASDAALFLRNTHFSLGFPAPTSPHVKDVGGLNIDFDLDKKPQLLNTTKYLEIKDFVDSSKDGFIYFNLGSIIKPAVMLPPGSFEKLYGGFSKLKVNVLMKWDGDVPKTLSPNIRLYNEFLPQMEILAHKNIKAFATHGGFLSICESINLGVPLIGMPVFGDQPMNVMRAVSHGYGIKLNVLNPHMTESLVATTVERLLKNPSYKAQAMRRSELFRDRTMRPVEEAVYWTEYVLKHGKVLQPNSARMPFYQVYLLDVLATILVGFLVLMYVVKKILCGVCSLVRANRERTTQNPQKIRATKKSKRE